MAVGLAAGLVLGASGVWLGTRGPGPDAIPARSSERAAPVAAPIHVAVASPESAASMRSTHSRFAVLAREAGAGVVNVYTSKTVMRPSRWSPFAEPFGGFFGTPVPRSRAPREFKVPSLGSGFVISTEGLILTNNHVVDGVDSITVIFSDGRQSPGEIVGQDPKTDIALIRVKERKKLHVLPLGDSDAVLPGDWVVAIGNPFGLDHTVTAGIVSAKGRDIGQGPYDDYIQTDAAINPGNSGGPLLDLSGAVIGINSAINPQANTIGFAVPINMAKEIIPQLEKSGYVVRGWLGVAVQPITPELLRAFDLKNEKGALVAQVTPGSPADEAGLERGDVIVRFAQQQIQKMRELPRIVSNTPVGNKVDVEVIRKGRSETLHVVVGKLRESEVARHGKQKPSGPAVFGMSVEDPTPALRRSLGLSESEGAVVATVEPGGPAERSGLRVGDVLIEVNRQPLRGAADLREKLDSAGDRVLLLVRRGDATIFLALSRS